MEVPVNIVRTCRRTVFNIYRHYFKTRSFRSDPGSQEEPLLPQDMVTPGAIQKMHTKISRGDSALNRGFGGLSRDVTRSVQPKGIMKWYSSSMLWFWTGCLLSFPMIFWIDFAYVAELPGFNQESLWNFYKNTLLKDNKMDNAAAMRRLAGIPLICAAVNLCIQHIRNTSFWWEKVERRKYYRFFDPVSAWSLAIIVLFEMRSAVMKAINSKLCSHVVFNLDAIMIFLILRGYYFLLDHVDALLRGMVQEQEVINSTATVQKMQNLVNSITRTGKPEKDYAYCFASANTVPAKVLSYLWSVYYIVGKVGGAVIALAVFMQVPDKILGNFIFSGAAFSAATFGGVMFELGPNTLSLFRLSLNRPFYVGDLLTLNTDGAMENPATSVMGFVENITIMYVVVRNFEMKQTWIPHAQFNKMIIQNWTRRPAKTVMLHIAISARCPAKRVKELQEFGKRWIQASPEVQQTNYQKCHLSSCSQGYTIEVIFFPAIGVTHRGIRQKFIIDFYEAGERLKIPFVPADLSFNFCDAKQHAMNVDDLGRGDIAEENANIVFPDLDDLMPNPDDLLPHRTMMPSAVTKRWLEQGEVV